MPVNPAPSVREIKLSLALKLLDQGMHPDRILETLRTVGTAVAGRTIAVPALPELPPEEGGKVSDITASSGDVFKDLNVPRGVLASGPIANVDGMSIFARSYPRRDR